MAVFVSNIVIEQGFDFDTTFELEDSTTGEALDLTDYTVTAQMRKTYTSSSATNFTVQLVDADSGELKISMDSDVTSNLKIGRYVYDIRLVSPSPEEAVSKAVEGSVLVRGGVTR